MKEWFFYAFLTIVFWSLWSIFPKFANQYISPQSILIFQVVGNLIATVFVLFSINFSPQIHGKAIIFSILSGIAGLVGTLFFLKAITKGSLSVVAVFTALYPVITIILSYLFFHEIITFKQGIGIIFAIIAIILFY